MSRIESLTCPHCRLNQFLTVDKKCRRCRKALILIVLAPIEDSLHQVPFPSKDPAIPSEIGTHPHLSYDWWIPIVLTYLRLHKGMTGTELGRRLGAEGRRTWLFRMEAGNIRPTANSVASVAEILDVPLTHVFELCEYLMAGAA